MVIIDFKFYKEGRERQTVRGLSYAQAEPLMVALRENDVDFKHIVWEETQSSIPMKEGEDQNEKTIRLQRVIRG